MSLNLQNPLVELRFQVPAAVLDAALQAVAPYVMRKRDPGSRHPAATGKKNPSVLPTSNSRYPGLTQEEVEMLLRGGKPKGR